MRSRREMRGDGEKNYVKNIFAPFSYSIGKEIAMKFFVF
jgi:hypothetical protein